MPSLPSATENPAPAATWANLTPSAASEILTSVPPCQGPRSGVTDRRPHRAVSVTSPVTGAEKSYAASSRNHPLNVHPGRDGSSRGQDAVPPSGTDCAPGTPVLSASDENDTVCTTPARTPTAVCTEGASPAWDDKGLDVANPAGPEGNTTRDRPAADKEDTPETVGPPDEDTPEDREPPDEDDEASGDGEGTRSGPSTWMGRAWPPSAGARTPGAAPADTGESTACAMDTRPALKTVITDTTATTGRAKRRRLWNTFHIRMRVDSSSIHTPVRSTVTDSPPPWRIRTGSRAIPTSD